MSEPNEVPGLRGDPVAELEKFIADTEARGEPVPEEARAMLARLRELMDALKGLTDSLSDAKRPERRKSSGDDDLH